mmetsp:Transcript_108560/g.302732  ORF Transcript_108560/g.302732 Transcript_108560/m.302732 type:complete len:416 (+) Transcript_108560:212-1459(+)
MATLRSLFPNFEEETLTEVARRTAELEADLHRSGEYGQLLLQRVEELEQENRWLREQVAESVDSSSDPDSQKASDAMPSPTKDLEDDDVEEDLPQPTQSIKRWRSRSDHRFSDVIRQNEELTEFLRQLERDRNHLRENNEELQRILAHDREVKAEQQAVQAKLRMRAEEKEKDRDVKHKVDIKAPQPELSEYEDECKRLQARIEQLRRQEVQTCAEAASLREQLAGARAECQEGRTLLAQAQELLAERGTEVEVLRGRVSELESTLEAECLQPRVNGSSLAVEMANQDGEQGTPRRGLEQLRDAEAMERATLGGVTDPLRCSLKPPTREEALARPSTLDPALLARRRSRRASEASDGERELRRLVGSLQQRNLELSGECERVRGVAATALRWERRLLALALLLLALLAAAAARAP